MSNQKDDGPVNRRHRVRAFSRLVFVDLRPLRESPGFRALFLGRIGSTVGRQVLIVATAFQVFDLTESSLVVGLLGAVQLVPSLALALIGGALADTVDRRKLIAITQTLLGVTSAGLALNALLAEVQVWPIFVLMAVNAGISAIDQPARTAVLPGLVTPEAFPSSLALLQLLNSLSNTVVPAVSGLLIAYVGLPVAYSFSAVGFGAAGLLIRRIPAGKPGDAAGRFGLDSITEGIRYLRGNRLIMSTMLMDLNAMIFGMPRALFPEWGTVLLGGNATTVGLLYAAPGTGAWLAGLTSGWMGKVKKRGRAVILAVMVWGVAIAAFGLTRTLPLALGLLAIAGAADVVGAVFRNAITQLTLPDHLRGRISSIHAAAVTSGPRLGDFEAGAVAALTSLQFSVISGGIVCVGGAWLISKWIPELDRFSSDDPLPDG
jgi:hypothetical protein